MKTSEVKPQLLNDAETLEAFANAGIPRRFQSKEIGLSNQPHCAPLCNMISDWPKFLQNLCVGRSLTICGSGQNAVSAFYLFCRKMLVSGLATKSFTLPRIMETLDEEGEDSLASAWEHSTVIGLSAFQNSAFKAPYPERLLHRMESLLRERVLNNQPVIIQGDPLRGGWWSPSFVTFIDQHNMTISIS